MSTNGSTPSGHPLACVIGEIDLVHALGLAGIFSVVVSPPGDFTRYSRFTRDAIDRVDALKNPAELTERLLAWSRRQPSKPVLYYNGDWDLLAVSRHRDQLREGFRFVVPEQELVEDLVDKTRFQRLAEKHELPVPRSVMLGSGAAPADLDLRFPVVVKPVTRNHANWKPIARAKVVQCDTPAELDALRSRLEEAGVDVLVQEFVPGPESLIESYHLYADETGTIVGEFTGKKIRTFPEQHGYSTALVLTDAPDLRELGRDIVARLDLQGVAKLDFKRDPEDGQLHLLEINPRFNLWHHPGAAAGVNIPELVYRDLVGLPRREFAQARAGVRWVSPWRDAQAVWTQHVPLRDWLPWMLSCETKCAVGWDDPFPFPRAVGHRALEKLRSRLRAR